EKMNESRISADSSPGGLALTSLSTYTDNRESLSIRSSEEAAHVTARRAGLTVPGRQISGVPDEPAATAAVHRSAARDGQVHLRPAPPLRRRPADGRAEEGRPRHQPGDRLPHPHEARRGRPAAQDRTRAAHVLRARLRLPGPRTPALRPVPQDDRVPEP